VHKEKVMSNTNNFTFIFKNMPALVVLIIW